MYRLRLCCGLWFAAILAVCFAMSGASVLMKAEEPKAKGKQKADKFSAKQYEFFEKQVLPILKANCFKCHGGKPKVQGGLRLISRQGVLEGGDSGPAVSLDASKKSVLVDAINYVRRAQVRDGTSTIRAARLPPCGATSQGPRVRRLP